jgi:aconitate hydratase
MGAELGCTSSIFPSDDRTKEFLESQGRLDAWTEILPDEDARYADTIEIDLSSLTPLIACPTSPDNVKKVSEVEGIEVAQVIVGSSVNSSFRDLMIVAKAVEARHSHPDVSFEINPGSHQVLLNVSKVGGAENLILAGARIHQSGCLGCIGMGQAPATGTVSLRTFPRNFPGRSGTPEDQVYLCSPETAAAAAIYGKITDPRKLGDYPMVSNPDRYVIDDTNFIFPSEETAKIEVIMGPNIKPFPDFDPVDNTLEGEVVLEVGDNITTDHIMPAGSQILPLRSNIEAISEYTFVRVDPTFPQRSRATGAGVIVAADNYGQGSSREHAAIAPRYLGIRAKVAKSFARIHKANLINFGVLPLTFEDPSDYDLISQGDRLIFHDVRRVIERGDEIIIATMGNKEIKLRLDVTERQRKILLAGGLIKFAAQKV